MKNLHVTLIIIFSIVFSACSSNDDPVREIVIPEKFDIKVEVNGLYNVPSTSISINSTQIKEWKNEALPFSVEYTYYTNGNEISSTSCNSIKISAWAYLSDLNYLESFNLYVDGKLVDTKTVIKQPTGNGILQPTVVEFTYQP